MAGVLLLAVFLLSAGFSIDAARLKNQVDRLSSQVETLLSQHSDLTARVDSLADQLSAEREKNRELLDSMNATLYEHDKTIKQRLQCTCENLVPPAKKTSPTDPIIEGDCAEYYSSGRRTSGVYKIGLLPDSEEAYCDMDTAGGSWTVLQRRLDGSVPFNRTWEEYKRGFGNKNGEYWLGNENIHHLTNEKNYTLRVDLEDWDGGKVYAEYTSFRVSDESDGYRLHLSGFSGTDISGDAMTGRPSIDGQRFSTVDRDNDEDRKYDCAQERGQGGWWYGSCGASYLNGQYLGNCGQPNLEDCAWLQGVIWGVWKGYFYSLKSASMKIRPTLEEEITTQPSIPRPATESAGPEIEGDCAEYYSSGRTTSGVYRIGLLPAGVEAHCDMDTAGGGWTVIQRRLDGSVPFDRTWEEYKHGFGNKSGEYWLGNENLHLLTNQKAYKLRIDMEDWEGETRYAEYDSFRVSGEYADQYRLHISGYNGTAGDSMTRYFSSDGMRFSTVDRDNDVNPGHCCQRRGEGGWWYGSCGNAYLNGRYLGNCGRTCPAWEGVVWHSFRGAWYSLKSVSMYIRPY